MARRKDKIFVPSKRLQKQYRKVRKKYERVLEETRRQPLTLEEAFEQGLVGSKVHQRQILTSVVDRITILANQYGVQGAAQLLNFDLNTLNFILENNIATPYQQALLEHAYTGLILDETLDIDFDILNNYAVILDKAVRAVNENIYEGNRLKNAFRYAVAIGKVDITKDLSENVEFLSYGLFNDLTALQKRMLMEWLYEDDRNNANEFFEAYRQDMSGSGGIWSNVQDSYFWSWFREIFYS